MRRLPGSSGKAYPFDPVVCEFAQVEAGDVLGRDSQLDHGTLTNAIIQGQEASINVLLTVRQHHYWDDSHNHARPLGLSVFLQKGSLHNLTTMGNESQDHAVEIYG